ncbi:GDP-mannose 4,6-dehydratase [Granulibacter bethesdensis]|uniref:GDP-mannose 4,6-dehydratase n=1 Tax=Granulibacter bethesdensis TaxID=364410 RepID=UPI000909E2D8|nr:GDP-mannose 4,6-dehydratase [Granulibacter bethesdensis]APH60072.1 GDP-mannose dehydratase family [Granulibacter bethesdensis]
MGLTSVTGIQADSFARILVTGSGGFVGSHLLPILRQSFPQAVFDAPRLSDGFDITDTVALEARIAAFQPDACIHLAAIAAPVIVRQNPDAAWKVNLHGSLGLANAILKHVPGCVLLYVSTADLYGASFRSGIPLDENAPPAPMNLYGATKAAADLALGALAGEGLRVIRARPFNHTGPGQSEDFVLPAFAAQIAAIEAGRHPPVMSVGNLDSWRDFLDVRDVCAAYVNMLTHADRLVPPGSKYAPIFNIASGTSHRIGDLLDRLLSRSRVSIRTETDPSRLRPADIPHAEGNATLARSVLGWVPRIALEQTLGDLLDDYRHHHIPDNG